MKKIFLAIKTFLFIQWNARKIAYALDDTISAMGHMTHLNTRDGGEKDVMLMETSLRRKLIHKATYEALPTWKWRYNNRH